MRTVVEHALVVIWHIEAFLARNVLLVLLVELALVLAGHINLTRQVLPILVILGLTQIADLVGAFCNRALADAVVAEDHATLATVVSSTRESEFMIAFEAALCPAVCDPVCWV
jgi:hypothetical protein